MMKTVCGEGFAVKMRFNALAQFVILGGIFRTISTIPIAMHLPAFALGLFYISRGKVSKYLLPGLAMGMLAVASCLVNGLGPTNVLKAIMLIGGVGIASLVASFDRSVFARYISGPVLFLVILALLIETAMIMAGAGARERSLDALVSGLGGISLPRYMGFRGGSAFSALLLGVLGTICWAHGYKKQAALYLVFTLLMMSRGPMLGLLVLLIYALVYSKFWRIVGGSVVVGILVGSPLIVYISQQLIPLHTQAWLVEASTMRYYSFIAFLQFGLENPIFGVGYDNYHVSFLDYSYSSEGRELGTFQEHRLHEAHNVMLDVWGELGILGYSFLALQVTINWVFLARTRYAPAFLYMCSCMFFISGASDWSLWVLTGLALSVHRSSQARKQQHL